MDARQVDGEIFSGPNPQNGLPSSVSSSGEIFIISDSLVFLYRSSSRSHKSVSVEDSRRSEEEQRASEQPNSTKRCARCALNLASLLVSRRAGVIVQCKNRRNQSLVVCMAPDEERLTHRNPLDFPIESVLVVQIETSSEDTTLEQIFYKLLRHEDVNLNRKGCTADLKRKLG
ncbi:hypothetical protein QQ045_022778 [Rhodiola kirilowii]